MKDAISPGPGAKRRARVKWIKTPYSESLSRRPTANTSPEIRLRKAIHSAGLRFRLRPALGERLTGDFLVLRYNICVFVDGCFWHRCPRGHKPLPKAGPNTQCWQEKFRRTAERDRRAVELAHAHGYHALRIWECDITDDLPGVLQKIAEACTSASHPRRHLGLSKKSATDRPQQPRKRARLDS
jgi:DNA mismatch endonuclease (patch repair protein)